MATRRRGCIIQRGGDTYELRFQVEDEKTGRNVTRTKRVHCRNLKEANRMLGVIHADVDNNRYSEPRKTTVKELLEDWVKNFASSKAGTTRDGYDRIVRNHLIPAFGEFLVDRLKGKHIQGYYDKLTTSGRMDGRTGGLSTMSIKHIHAVLSEVFRYAVENGITSENPAKAARPPQVVHEEMNVLTPDELLKLFDACKKSMYGNAIFLAARSGMRRGEILGLKWRDISFDRKTLSVNRALAETSRGIQEKEPKTKRSRRLISLDDETVAMLRRHKEEQQQIKIKMKGYFKDNDWVFAYESGKHWVPKYLSTAFSEIIRKVGVPIVRFHDLRHTHATILLSQGVHVKIVSERLGHSSVSITLDTYSHVLPHMQDEATQKFADAMRKALEK